jgi:hypothetical protein
VTVSRIELTATPEAPHRASITVAQGLFCGLDGASLTAVTGAITVDRSEAHTLRCATTAAGEGTVEYALAADPIAPLRVDAALASSDAARHNGEVRLVVRDAAGAPLTRDRVTVTTATTAVTLGDVRRGDEAGVYLLAATWPADARTLALRLDVDGTSTDLAPIALPEAPVAAAPAPDTFAHRLSLRVEAGGAYVLSGLQRNNDPMRFNGVTPALSWGFGGQVLAGLQLLHPEGGHRGSALALQLGGGYWYLPSERPGKFVDIALVGGGLRAEPFSGRTRFFVDVHGYMSLSGGLVRGAFDVGLGVDVALGPSVLLGPYARYQQIIEFGDALTDDDARLVTAGIAFSLRPASARW